MMQGLSDKNILVTGGAGFIGSNLVGALSAANRVFVLDNLSSGQTESLGKGRDHITFIQGDILDKGLLKEVVSQVEFVFHLAANTGNVKSIEDPAYDMEVNSKGTVNLLEACLKSKIKRLIYASSAAVFGEGKFLPIDEDHPVNPESPYGVSKLAAEKYCFAFHKVHGLPVTALRYFNVYGPRQGTSRYTNVIAIFFQKLREGKPLTIYGDGKQTRDFIFVDDIVRANILAAVSPAAVGEVCNIGTGQETTVNQLVNLINEVSGRENKIIRAEPRVGEIRRSWASIDKAGKVLGFSPKVALREGMFLTHEAEMSTH